MARVFVSHRTADVVPASRLARELRDAGHEVTLDVWDLKVGDSIVSWISESLQQAQYVILCCSASGVMAPWISREWMSALARQLEGENVTLIPVRLSGGAPPAVLRDIRFADLVDDWDRGLAEILVVLA